MSFVAVAQYCASSFITKNLKICVELIEKASRDGAKVVLLLLLLLIFEKFFKFVSY
jgi:predicted amidohydrolase